MRETIKRVLLMVAGFMFIISVTSITGKAYCEELQVLPGGINGVENADAAAQEWAIWSQNDPPGTVVITPNGTYIAGQGNAPTPSTSNTATKPAAQAQPKTTTTPKETKSTEQTKEKVTVWFTDAVGHVLGFSEITKGTTIGKNQFVKDVPDFDGAKFFAWAYDGKAIEHEVIIRALYKTEDGKYYDPASESWNQYIPK